MQGTNPTGSGMKSLLELQCSKRRANKKLLQPETNAAFAQNTQIKGTITGITTQLSETGAVQKAFNINNKDSSGPRCYN